MRSVLVTGGTTRLGLAIAERLRADGWRVLTSSHRADSGADIVADLSEPLGAAKLYAACLLVAPQKLTMLMAGRETGRGAVVNILDCRVLCGAEGEGAYFRTKRALLDYTMKSAAMFAETLCVNAVAPGPVLAPTEVHEKAGETPFGRPAPEDVASAVSFLLSARATGGCVVPVDGGQSLF